MKTIRNKEILSQMRELEFAKHSGFLYHFNNYQPTYKKMGEGWREIFCCLTNFPGFDIHLL
jgi:hypothetical protein